MSINVKMYKHLKIFEVGMLYSNCKIEYLEERTNIVRYLFRFIYLAVGHKGHMILMKFEIVCFFP